ncbi:MAG: hydroxyacylglutathione hydrolase [Alphaproteobacteria bacterium]|nr:hydroxyacylglutathione hydrolase [Alphaproteobacteria bacterium]
MLDVTIIPVLQDNYSYLIRSGDIVGIIDPGEAAPVIEYLDKHGLKPDFVLNTHHHGDHIAGNQEIIQKYGAQLIAPKKEKRRIKNINMAVSDGDVLTFGIEEATIIETPGHTSGHICFWFQRSKALFCGDTLFAMGCGRLFEGTAQEMFDNFQLFKQMPDDTKIYCGHEYTLDNAKFCAHIFPDNQDIQKRLNEVQSIRAQDLPTIPSTLKQEKKTNIFMMANSAEEFANLRSQKDKF